MSYDLTLATLAIRRDRTPDWSAAAEAIDCLDLATVWATGDDFFPLEAWLGTEPAPSDTAPRPVRRGRGARAAARVPVPPDAVAVRRVVRNAQRDLALAAQEVRTALEYPSPGELLVIELPQHVMYVTGGATSGDPPSELFEPFTQFAEAGIARAAGFEWSTRYAAWAIDDRRPDFKSEDLRAVRAARAFLYAEDAAIPKVPRYKRGSPDEWLARLRGPLQGAKAAVDDDAAGRALLHFFSEALALMVALQEASPDRKGVARERIVEEAVELLDHVASPRRRSIRRVADLAAHAFEPFARLLAASTDEGDVEWASELERQGGSVSPGVETELSVRVISEGLTALADVFGDRLCEIRPEHAAHAIRPDRAAGSLPPAELDYRCYLAWCAVRRWDWEAAEAAIGHPSVGLFSLRDDLDDLRDAVEGETRSLVTCQAIEDVRVWLTVSEEDFSTLGGALRRLGEAGVLRAAGALAWG